VEDLCNGFSRTIACGGSKGIQSFPLEPFLGFGIQSFHYFKLSKKEGTLFPNVLVDLPAAVAKAVCQCEGRSPLRMEHGAWDKGQRA
jgi:hypothetical protein